MKLIIVFVVALGILSAQTPQTHSVTLTWADTANPAGTTYSVYRSPGLCSGSPVFAKLAAAVTEKTYKDTTVQAGNYCYAVTATHNGMESAQSNTALAPVPSFAPSALSVTVQ